MSNLSERISKVKFKEGEWVIHTVQPLDEGDKESVIKLRAQPHPDMVAAFQALEYITREIWGFPESWAKDKISIVGVSYSLSESTNVEGATVTALVTLEDTSTSPGVLNTPHVPYAQYAEGGTQPIMSGRGVELLETFRRECGLYVSGKKRAQGNLFDETPAKKSPETLAGMKKLRVDLREINGRTEPSLADEVTAVTNNIVQHALQKHAEIGAIA